MTPSPVVPLRVARAADALALLLAFLLSVLLSGWPVTQALADSPKADGVVAQAGSQQPLAVSQSVEAQTPALAAPSAGTMAALPHDLSPWGMFLAADIVVKAVMIGLAAASFMVWTIWLGKLGQLWLAQRRLQADLAAMTGGIAVDVAARALHGRFSLARGMLEAADRELRAIAAHVPAASAVEDRIATRLAEIEAHANRSIRGGMSFLATVGAAAPFIGLFGTVWGIMNSFIGISKAQTTNLAVVAPGIAEALLATAIGLVAAIPAVILYNQLGHGIAGYKRLTRETKGEVGRIVSRQVESVAASGRRAHLSVAAE